MNQNNHHQAALTDGFIEAAASRIQDKAHRESLVILPTYNEASNLKLLVSSILHQGPFDVLIVDDNSPDGTGAVAETLAKRFAGRVHVLHRSGKLGLGTAYVEGFRYALAMGYQQVFTMDADFSLRYCLRNPRGADPFPASGGRASQAERAHHGGDPGRRVGPAPGRGASPLPPRQAALESRHPGRRDPRHALGDGQPCLHTVRSPSSERGCIPGLLQPAAPGRIHAYPVAGCPTSYPAQAPGRCGPAPAPVSL